MPTKYWEFFPTLFVKTTDFQLVFNFKQTRTVNQSSRIALSSGSVLILIVYFWLYYIFSFYRPKDIGRAKAVVAAEFVNSRVAGCNVTSYPNNSGIKHAVFKGKIWIIACCIHCNCLYL